MNIPISQDIKVNDKVLQAVDDGGKLDNSIGNIISDIADIISQMYALFKKMRDLLSAYGGKQFELLFNIKAAAMKNQREAIEKQPPQPSLAELAPFCPVWLAPPVPQQATGWAVLAGILVVLLGNSLLVVGNWPRVI